MSGRDARDEARMAQAPQARDDIDAGVASAAASIGAPAGGAPPLGQRPAEPLPGKESLEDPQGRKAAGADGDGGGKDSDGTCPDCGLPFKDHPDFAAGHHDPAHGHGGRGQGHVPTTSEPEFAADQRHAHFDPRDAPGSPGVHEQRLPGEELDQESLGGDQAGA